MRPSRKIMNNNEGSMRYSWIIMYNNGRINERYLDDMNLMEVSATYIWMIISGLRK
jgi:hypothetical protein